MDLVGYSDTNAVEKLFRSDRPDIGLIKSVLDKNLDLVDTIINDNYSLLHLAARTDTLYGTNLTVFLFENYKVNPNIKNSGGSIPLFWALAAYEETEFPFLDAILILLNHPSFKYYKSLIYRGPIISFIKNSYKNPVLLSIIEDFAFNKKLPLIRLVNNIKISFI